MTTTFCPADTAPPPTLWWVFDDYGRWVCAYTPDHLLSWLLDYRTNPNTRDDS
jgi:hypothetical protein